MRTRFRGSAAGLIPGSARGDEDGAAVRDQGKRAEARDLPASGLRLVHRGFDTLDLKQDKTLLTELAS